MLDLLSFVKSMKISWIKRLLTSNNTWDIIITSDIPNVKEIVKYGSKKIYKMIESVNNSFWKDVLEAFATFSNAFQPEVAELLAEGVWYSQFTKFKLSIIKTWDKKGIRFLSDLIDTDTGKIHTKESLERTFDVKMTVLCYTSLIRSLPESLKDTPVNKIHGPVMPLRMNLVQNHAKLTRLAYVTYLENRGKETIQSNAKLKQKWLRDIGSFEENSMIAVMNATKSNRMRIFQYKLSNRIIATNKYLKMISIKEDDSCTFCNLETETLVHLFWQCNKVQSFIRSIKTNLLNKYCIKLDIQKDVWFFPNNLSPMETLITTLSKMVIYEARLDESSPSLTHLRNKLTWEIEVEIQTAQLASQKDIFWKKWIPMTRFIKEQCKSNIHTNALTHPSLPQRYRTPPHTHPHTIPPL